MAKRVARFEKVSKSTYDKYIENFYETYKPIYGMIALEKYVSFVPYDEIKLPIRSTKKSAGYDIFSGRKVNSNICIPGHRTSFAEFSGETKNPSKEDNLLLVFPKFEVPTFLKCRIDDDWVFKIYPKSGYSTRTLMELANTVGIIDSDYYNNDNNEGHIIIMLTYPIIRKYPEKQDDKNIIVKENQKLVQGIFTEYGITEDDEAEGIREGGFGSTGL